MENEQLEFQLIYFEVGQKVKYKPGQSMNHQDRNLKKYKNRNEPTIGVIEQIYEDWNQASIHWLVGGDYRQIVDLDKVEEMK